MNEFSQTCEHSSLPATDAAPQKLFIRFTGSGAEYFRIWIINMLLTLLTLSLYWPFARARRLRYFHSNTLIGQEALAFHGDAWKMFRGYVVMLALGSLYWGISTFASSMLWLPLLVFAVLWPAMWRASLIFRLRNTSWRGLRFDFLGPLSQAYAVVLPIFIPLVLLAAAASMLQAGGDALLHTHVLQQYAALLGFGIMVFAGVFPWLVSRIHRYQHGGYGFAQEHSRLALSTPAWYKLYLKNFALLSLSILALSAGFFLLVFALHFSESDRAAGFITSIIFLVALYLFLLPLISSYITSRQQNLVWGNTSSEHVVFHSQLRFKKLLQTQLSNGFLIIITLGLYRPFADVRLMRLRLEAVHVEVSGDMHTWLAQTPAPSAGVIGDAMGDFFGLDMGL